MPPSYHLSDSHFFFSFSDFISRCVIQAPFYIFDWQAVILYINIYIINQPDSFIFNINNMLLIIIYLKSLHIKLKISLTLARNLVLNQKMIQEHCRRTWTRITLEDCTRLYLFQWLSFWLPFALFTRTLLSHKKVVFTVPGLWSLVFNYKTSTILLALQY